MKAAPVSLTEYFVTDLSLTANPSYTDSKRIEFKQEDMTGDLRLSCVDTAAKKWQLTMEIKHQAAPETNSPYAFRVVIVGFFTVAGRVVDEEQERTVKIQGASVLYGVAREIVRAMTGRGPHRPILIPTVSFYEVSKTVAPTPVEATIAASAPAATQ